MKNLGAAYLGPFSKGKRHLPRWSMEESLKWMRMESMEMGAAAFGKFSVVLGAVGEDDKCSAHVTWWRCPH